MAQQNNQSPSLPLWKRLNGEREHGYTFSNTELRSFVPEGWEFFRAKAYTGEQIGIKYRKPYAEGEPHYNEDGFEYKELFVTAKEVAANKYTALAVNHLASLAEALSNFINISEQRKDHHSPFEAATLLQAKEALNKIS